MSSINKVLLVGHLGIDPELRTTSGGDPFCGFTLATSRTWTDKQGARQERTTWHRITVWGREAETCAQHLGKGSLVGVEGSLEQREYTNKEGQQQRIMEVRSQHVSFLGPKRASAAPSLPPSQQSYDAYRANSSPPEPGEVPF